MTKIFTDQMGREVKISTPPKRIVSIVPSQTELLFDLGLGEAVVGLTKFCIHPGEKWKDKTKVGGTKKLHIEKIASLKPNLILGNKEENDRQQIEQLEKDFPVWMSDIYTLEDALEMITSVGEITAKNEKAAVLSEKIQQAFQQLKKKPANTDLPSLSVAYLIWKNPYMAAASGTFINSMLHAMGLQNIFSQKTRYPETTLEELAALKPDVVLLSSEPFPFREKHLEEIKQQCPAAVVKLVDGEMFSWYGSRLLQAAPYFANLRLEITHALEKISQ
ncbi:MAG: ABC transporter substrate-binding protein [Lewinellaceae bacterium]|nr:ABC transporter substrate-binding protein [Saprospiraceae bacterium]MCB9339093.1 ABC transporter substrate-binding protein [Lewinellaceae bacterium]